MERIKTAVIGCGMISYIYLKNFQHLFSVIDLVGVCDRSEEKAREKSRLFQVSVMTMEEIKASPEIRLVVNLTGPAAHYSVIRELLEAGKNVYTEKTLCVELEQGKELVALAKAKGLCLGVAPDTFLGAGLQTARLLIDRGMIGRVTSARAAVNRSHALNSELFPFIRNPGGGFAYDIGIYYVTALLSLLGPVKKVTWFVSEPRVQEARILRNGGFGRPFATADSNLYAGSLLFESGAPATLHLDGESIDEEQSSLVIYGTEGILKLGDPNSFHGSVRLLRNNAPEARMPFTHGFAGMTLYGPETPADYGQHRGVGAAEMAWAMIGHRPHRASAEMGLHAMEVLHGLDVSSREEKVYGMTTSFQQPSPLPSGYTDQILGGIRCDAEGSLVNG